MQDQAQATFPRSEAERLRELYSLKLLDIQLEERFQRYAQLAADVLEAPIAFVSLVGRDRLWFKATCGLSPGETSRSASFCTHAVAADELLVVEDAREDARFADNPLVHGAPYIRFYAGQPIHGPSGQPLGTLCIFDYCPRALAAPARSRLALLARMVEHEIAQSYQLDLLREELERTAYYDPLTRLPNQRLVRDRLEYVLRLADQEGWQVGVALLDVEGFSAINHEFGVGVGDALLCRIATGLQHLHPEPCIVGRWHDDAFVVVEPRLQESPSSFARGVRCLFERPFRVEGRAHHLDVQLGVAVHPDAGGDADTLLRNATTALQASRSAGAHPTRVYHANLEHDRARRLSVVNRLRPAIVAGEVGLYYQPKLDTSGRYLQGAEALVRWVDPELGAVAADELVSVAEQSGLIDPLGEQLLWLACQQAAEWEQQGLVVPVAVNLSPSQLHQPNLVRRVRNALAVSGLPGERLYLEVTESSLIEDVEVAVRVIRELAEQGVRVAIDDFGTGYSSFAYLAELPVASVKIDRHFIASVDTQPATAKVVASIVGLAHGLGLSVVAEGVETAEQLRALDAVGCDEIQGFYFSRPLEPQQMARYARSLERPAAH